MGFVIPPPPMEKVQVLMARKDAIQHQLDGQFAILSANNATLRTKLVDPQGFPRADIDVYAVRHARVRIIELKNDMDAVMNDLAKALEGVYDAGARNGGNVAGSTSNSSQTPEELKVFARVDGVAPGSPAAEAGLLREDLILQFGTLTTASFPSSSLQPIAEVVASHENKSLDIVILREETQKRTLRLIPRKGWGGRGLLGYVSYESLEVFLICTDATSSHLLLHRDTSRSDGNTGE
ncbi:hypothetical protein K439DRAFT_1365650 [Ramaria rubella]|nr:hypothetical protein K439DRAFT_1365650 [Ramaria rubella]